MARSFAKELSLCCKRNVCKKNGVPSLHVPLQVITSKYYGESERLLSSVFNAGNELANGAIIFLDEINSFEMEFFVPALEATEGGPPSFDAVFIRAPAIIESGPAVEILAEYYLSAEQQGTPDHEEQRVAVAVRQGNVLASAFHPELTSDTRWHSLLLKVVGKNEEDQPALV